HMGDEPILIALPGASAPEGWVRLEAALESAESVELKQGPSYQPMPYTSGTTGFPKGVYRPPSLQREAVTRMFDTFTLRKTDVHLMAGAGYHSAVGLFSSLTTAIGATIVVMPRFNPEQALALIERHRVTTTFMPPTPHH